MIKFFKWLFKVLAATALLGIIAVVGMITVMDPNQFKEVIRQQVALRTGRILTLQGPMYWRIDPDLCLEAYDVALGNAKTFPKEFLTVKRARLGANWRSLFSGKFLIDIELQGLALNLNRDPTGLSNWEDLQPLLSMKDSLHQHLLPFNVTLSDTKISWQDFQHHQHYQISDLDFSAKKLSSGWAGFSAPISLNFKIQDQNAKQAKIVVNGEWHFNEKLQQIDVHNLALKLGLSELPPATLTAELQIQNFAHSPLIQGTLQVLEFDLKNWLSHFDLSLAPYLCQTTAFSASFRYHFPSLEVASFNLQLENQGMLEGNFSIPDFRKNFKALNSTASLHGKALQLGPYAVNEIKTTLVAKEGLLNFEPLYADIAGTTHHGTLAIDLRSYIPQFSVSTQTDSFEINELFTLFNENDRLYGRLHAMTTLSTQGHSLHECIGNLSGQTQLTLTDGRIRGIELPPLLQHAQSTVALLSDNLLKKQPTNVAAILTAELGEWKQQAINHQQLATPFRIIEATIQVVNGQLHTNNFKLVHADYTLSGHGTLDLIQRNIEYQANALLNRATPTTNVTNDLAIFLKDTPLAIQLKGPLNNFSVQPDLAQYAEGALKIVKPAPETPGEGLSEQPTEHHTLERLFGFP